MADAQNNKRGMPNLIDQASDFRAASHLACMEKRYVAKFLLAEWGNTGS